MNENFAALINQIKANQNFFAVDEANTKNSAIAPILNILGWNVFDITEVRLEYPVENRKIDYSLRLQEQNKVFLEAKKASEADLERHQNQLLDYSFREGVELAILTNGITWWFYLPLERIPWEQRKFFTIDLNEQSIEDCIEKFQSLLSKMNVGNGTAYQNAKMLFESRQKNKIIKENLPKAWQKLVSEPDEMLVELLNETLEKICGYKAEDNQVAEFLNQLFSPQIHQKPLATSFSSKPSNTFLKENTNNLITEDINEKELIKIDLEKTKDLHFAKVVKGKFAHDTSNNWRGILNIGLRIAHERGIGIDKLGEVLNANFRLGFHNDKTYTPTKGTNFSMQNLSSPNTAKNILKLAEFLECEVYILFEWEQGKFLGKQGLIHWKP